VIRKLGGETGFLLTSTQISLKNHQLKNAIAAGQPIEMDESTALLQSLVCL
jgi:hypothetical protein